MDLINDCLRRIERLQLRLADSGLDGAVFPYPIDIYYLTGTRQNALLWVPAEDEPVLFVRKSLLRARSESAVDDVRPFPRSKELAALINGERIGLTCDVIPVQQYDFYRNVLPGRDFSDISQLMREMRSIKSDFEIDRMRYSGVQLSRVFASMREYIQPGLRELDIAAEFESRLRRIGGEGLVRMRAFNQELFMGLTVAGKSAAAGGFFNGAATGLGLSRAAPHGASQSVVEAGQPIMLDYTGIFDGYIVDMTRMFACGELSPRLQNGFDVACAIQDAVAERLQPGAVCSEIYEHAVELAKKAGLTDYFMGPPGEQAQFIGHGVGLELDEFPVLAPGFDMPLQLGQTLAVEPKFTFVDEGIVGIENTYVVTQEGGERISVLEDDLMVV